MTMTTDTAGPWVPAPGSVARRTWPLPARWAWWLLHRPALALALAVVVAVGVLAGPVVLGVGLVVLVAGLVVWWRVWPASFEATAGRVLLGVWRSA
jgi:hypothetical protein